MDAVADLALLRRFEPVLRFNRGERFYPMDSGAYVSECSLWVYRPGQAAECLIPEGSLTLDKLAAPPRQGADAVTYLQFIEPLNVAELARWQFSESLRRKDPREVFHPGRGRLARVGYGSRFLGALFSLTLLARGRVPGDTAAAAAMTYQSIMQNDERYVYHGRVLRENGWIVLQYYFFYPYNNWRTGFFGVNDHEADWEKICIYLYETEAGEATPEWAAYAAHYYSGDDFRRRWDDPELEKIGEHPVVYIGAGSHASYFAPGDYLTEVDIPFLRPLVRLADRFNYLRGRALADYHGVQIQQQVSADVNIFHVPFVDYARGDGYAVGPGQEREWADPVLLDPVPGWAQQYRGLWGLYARDPLSGEDAPGGPLYNHDGSLRKEWSDPLAWAGLDKTPPPSQALEHLYERRAEILDQRDDLLKQIETMTAELARLGVIHEAVRDQPHLRQRCAECEARMSELRQAVSEARAQIADNDALLAALDDHTSRLSAGQRGDPRAHIHRAHRPIPPESLRRGVIAEFWAAVSVSLLLIAFVVLAVLRPASLWVTLGVVLGAVLIIEYGFRRKLGQLLTMITLALAVIGAGILFVHFFWPIVVTAVLLIGGYLLFENLRELVRR